MCFCHGIFRESSLTIYSFSKEPQLYYFMELRQIILRNLHLFSALQPARTFGNFLKTYTLICKAKIYIYIYIYIFNLFIFNLYLYIYLFIFIVIYITH